MDFPTEFLDKFKAYVKNERGLSKTIGLPVGIEEWKHLLFGQYMVIPDNTVGSDDCHEYEFTDVNHNVKKVFEADLDVLIAKVSIYEKIDPSQPAFFLVYCPYEQAHQYLVVIWP